MIKLIKKIGIMALLLSLIVNVSYSQELTSNILLGQTLEIDSKYLNETREVFIYVPEGYLNSSHRYPVLYVLDGETHFFTSSALSNFFSKSQQIPELIVVAIPNVPGHRNLDFTPVGNEPRDNLGGAENFLAFMREELMPAIDNNYRTYDFHLLFGHSLTGMFSIYTLFNHTEMFDAMMIASPFLMWDEDYVVKDAEKRIANSNFKDMSLFISIGDEPNYFDSLDKLTGMLKNNNTGLNWDYSKYDGDNHDSIPITTLTQGLGFIFSDWPLTQEIAMGGLESVNGLLDNRLQKYGIKTELNEVVINNIGYQLLQANEVDKAIEMFKHNVKLFPKSSNVYDSLGDGYDTKGLKKMALKNYKKAVDLGSQENSPNLEAYKNNVERLVQSK